MALTARPINMEYRLDKQVRHPLHIQAVLHPCPFSAVSFPMMIPATHCAPSIPRSLRAGVNRTGMRRRSEEHTSELQSLMRISYAVFCLNKKNNTTLQIKQIKLQIQ